MRNTTNFSDGAARVLEDTDFRSGDAPGDRSADSGDLEAAYRRSLQALRDVRHMLPAEGIAIVDAIIDGPIFEGQGQGTLLFVLTPFAGEAEPLNPVQEIEFLEGNSVN